MSNCIDFKRRSNELHLNIADVDTEALQAMMELHHKCNPSDKFLLEPHGKDENANLTCFTSHWFLNHLNVTITSNQVEIKLGHAKSGHTWRDFRQTLWLISQFITRDMWLTFYLEDEGFPGVFPAVVHLVPKSWPLQANGKEF